MTDENDSKTSASVQAEQLLGKSIPTDLAPAYLRISGRARIGKSVSPLQQLTSAGEIQSESQMFFPWTTDANG